MATPYDGKIGFWQWTGDSIGEATIEELANTIRNFASSGDAIYVKTSDGINWQGRWDSKANLAINGPDDIARWVNSLSSHGFEFHAWCVVKGLNVAEEAKRIIEACQVPGVQSMILDIEPYDGFFAGDSNTVVELMSTVRTALGPGFHFGMAMDPRQQHYDSIFPNAWRLYINSLHPFVYWEEMGREPIDVINETYKVWGNYGLPIFPILQGYATPNSIKIAQDNSRSVRGAPGVSYYRLGVIGPSHFPVINDEIVDSEIGPDSVRRGYAEQLILRPNDSGYSDGSHTTSRLKQFNGVGGYPVKHKATTSQADEVWARWRPTLPVSGKYEISVYIPGRHATTKKAAYHVHGIKGQAPEVVVKLDQSRYANQWVPLVIYEFDATVGSAQVNLTDLTGEVGAEIAFDAVRWRRVVSEEQVEVVPEPTPTPTPTPSGTTAGFNSPIGTLDERNADKVWPGFWFDATGFATFYTFVGGSAYHTGADLNLNHPRWNADRDAPIYAPADGTIVFSGNLQTWGEVIVVRHDPLPNGQVVWSRLAHVASRTVSQGDRVTRGQQLARIGNADGVQPYHLHFDIVKTDICERRPGHWPGTNRDLVFQHYLNPKQFIIENRPTG